MIVRIDKSLEKDVKKIKDSGTRLLLAEVILEIQKAERVSEIQNHQETPRKGRLVQNKNR